MVGARRYSKRKLVNGCVRTVGHATFTAHLWNVRLGSMAICLPATTPGRAAYAINVDPSLLPGRAGSLGSRGYLQFAEDVRDVIAHRLWTEHETRRDLWIGQVLRDQSQDFLFSLGQFREGLDGWCGHGGLEHGEV